MSARRIDAVVFDFGGVLITTINNQVGDVAATHGVELAVMHEVLLGPRASGADHPWHRAERGEIEVADIQGALGPWADAAGVDLRGDEIDRLMVPGGYAVVDEMLGAVAAVRRDGFGTALLTNTFAEFRPTMERDIDFALFDVVVESFAVGARKPEPVAEPPSAAPASDPPPVGSSASDPAPPDAAPPSDPSPPVAPVSPRFVKRSRLRSGNSTR